jgi:hypothetical protein
MAMLFYRLQGLQRFPEHRVIGQEPMSVPAAILPQNLRFAERHPQIASRLASRLQERAVVN